MRPKTCVDIISTKSKSESKQIKKNNGVESKTFVFKWKQSDIDAIQRPKDANSKSCL